MKQGDEMGDGLRDVMAPDVGHGHINVSSCRSNKNLLGLRASTSRSRMFHCDGIAGPSIVTLKDSFSIR
jgi:hypothetical protein